MRYGEQTARRDYRPFIIGKHGANHLKRNGRFKEQGAKGTAVFETQGSNRSKGIIIITKYTRNREQTAKTGLEFIRSKEQTSRKRLRYLRNREQTAGKGLEYMRSREQTPCCRVYEKQGANRSRAYSVPLLAIP